MLSQFALLILSLTTTLVRAGVPPSNGFFRITDFESRCVDLHNNRPVDFNPIHAFTPSPGQIAQNWLLQPTGPANQFRISNAGAFTFVSYTTAPIAGDPTRAQVCAHPNAITLWNITANGNAGFNILDSQFGLAMTSWPFQPALISPSAPLTLEPLDPTQARQIFTFLPFT
ncbi:hypothetical protein C8R47DRAFT_1159881 [Mycena vitilis]|nr:hypothetical protein C8R47DRAFT_1159881 [Mycena vitilis]